MEPELKKQKPETKSGCPCNCGCDKPEKIPRGTMSFVARGGTPSEYYMFVYRSGGVCYNCYWNECLKPKFNTPC